MSLKIGDFVWYDYCVAEIQKDNVYDTDFRGYSLGCASVEYMPFCFMYQEWYISKNASKITIKHLDHITQAIKENHPELQKPEVKKFLNRLSQYTIRNLL